MSEETTNSNLCPNCQAPVDQGATFCSKCGETVYPRGKKKKKPVSIWILALLTLAGSAFALMGACGAVYSVLLATDKSSWDFLFIPLVIAAVCIPLAVFFFTW